MMPKMELVLGLSASQRWPGWPTSIALRIDMGSLWMNRAVHGFLNVGAVAACKAAAEDTSEFISTGVASDHKLEHSLKKMCKEGAYWGAVAGVYEAVEYGVERIRGRNGWTNAMIGGAITGALISAATVAVAGTGTGSYRGKVIKGAITGGAVATAAELINQRSRVALAPFTFGETNGTKSWELQHGDMDVGSWVVARGLELPSTEIDHIPGWPDSF
ncbi:hypothetical protein EJB05_50014 [Eragrostis curvula]|uniref:Uncharacterized protein n=1 Tax=Eragrostis curvula TaxID=38414 RepID=A0A5J9SZM2_9POAL|nr:hypothetical protein EJB05_50014 [Eragrostis curvula]